MKAATVVTRRTPALGRRTSTTPCPTRTGTTLFGPPVTIINHPIALLRRCYQTTKSVVSLAYLLRKTHLGVWKTASSENQKSRQHLLMGKKHKNLFDEIISSDNLYLAYKKTKKGKQDSPSHLVFREHLATNLAALRTAMASGTYIPGKPHMFFVNEPKRREITAMPFMDRVAQHAVCNVIEPIFDKVFLPQSHACRTGRGTHSAANSLQAELRHLNANGAKPWVLKTDFSRYFASVKRDVLHKEFGRKISCQPTLRLLEKMIPPVGLGLPIGNLTSQLSANVYGHIIDRWLVHTMGITRFFRYMDDIVVLGHSREAMDLLRLHLELFSTSKVGLKFSHWSVLPANRGINFVGYRIWATHKLLRRDSVLRAKRKINRYKKYNETDRLNKFLSAWKGHASHAETFNLIKKLGVRNEHA